MPTWVRTYPKSTSTEFFVPARTLIAIKLLRHHLGTTKYETSSEKILFYKHASNTAHIDCNLSH